MTETIDGTPAASGDGAKVRGGGLSTMLIADLRSLAGGLGIPGAGSMKKAQLVDAIKAARAEGSPAPRSPVARRGRGKAAVAEQPAPQAEDEARAVAPTRPATGQPEKAQPEKAQPETAQSETAQSEKAQREKSAPDRDEPGDPPVVRTRTRSRSSQKAAPEPLAEEPPAPTAVPDSERTDRNGRAGRADQGGHHDHQSREQQGRSDQQPREQEGRGDQFNQSAQHDDLEGGGRNRRRRGRDRERNRAVGTANNGGGAGVGSGVGVGASERGTQRHEPDTTILEDDVLVPAAGILDVLDNYAFVRTSGYLAGTDDVYVSLSMVRRFGLRRGDAIVGQVRQPREGERKEKFNPMVQIDTVNGGEPETSKHRVEFDKLTPLHPSERLRLETGPTNLIGRVIDIAAPIGKGQRGLIVSPAKAGKTMVLQSIAASITANNPECHLMVVLLDERPEEVTDFERAVNGEVISSTFDRPPADHTAVAELAIERAKRLVELGHDVVVLLDGITRLARAYHLCAPSSGRALAGGVDPAALHPPKRFFGAARNIENGGSLTILATAGIESGSGVDEMIFEEFEGTANLEIRLRRDLADRRLFPAIDAVRSGTRREDLLMSQEEVEIVWKLRRLLGRLEGQQALETLLERLRKSQTNIEFLMRVQKDA